MVFGKDAHHSMEELAESGYEVVGVDWTIKPQRARQVHYLTITNPADMLREMFMLPSCWFGSQVPNFPVIISEDM